MAFPAPAPLVEAKLAPPRLRREVLAREPLLDALADPRDERVVTLVAPPGYGKTTLLGIWRSRERRPVAWLTLDGADTDPIRMLGYLAVAIDRAVGIDASVLQGIEFADTSPVTTVVPRLVAAMQRSDRPLVVILDDVHVLAGSASVDAVTMLLDYLPHGVRLALAGRVDGGLPLARLRARGRLLEVTTTDLALDTQEAARLLELDGWHPGPDAVRELHARTEGWPAALYLAGLAAAAAERAAADAGPDAADGKGAAVDAGPIPAGAGRRASAPPRSPSAGQGLLGAPAGRSALAEYLDAELLGALDPAARDFLVRTSILERLSGPLCDAVLGREGSGLLLRDLAATNRLVTPLEGEGEWYRYHALLREHLARLLADAGGAADLHRRAATWLEAHDEPDSAVDHLFAAGDPDAAAALVIRIGLRVWREGRGATTVRWLGRFDDAAIRRNPIVGVMAAWIDLLGGRAAEGARMVDLVDGATYGPVRPPGADPYESISATVRALMARAGFAAAVADAERAPLLIPSTNPWHVTSEVVLGAILCITGDARADSILAEAEAAARPQRASRAEAWACAWRGMLAIERGDWEAAGRFARDGLDLTGRLGVTDDVGVAAVAIVAARAALYRGAIDGARRHLAAFQASRPALGVGMPWASVRILLEAARAYVALADPAGARTMLLQAEEIIHRRPDLGPLPAEVAALRARMADLPPGPGGASTLTPAELRVLRYLPTYLSTAEIAARLFVAPSTVKTQVQAVYGKLGATSRAEAVELAIETGLLEPLPILADDGIRTS